MAEPDDGWIRVPSVEAQLVGLDGVPVLVCRLGDVLYAYRDACLFCGGVLSRGVLAGSALACPGCGSRYDVHLAGAVTHVFVENHALVLQIYSADDYIFADGFGH